MTWPAGWKCGNLVRLCCEDCCRWELPATLKLKDPMCGSGSSFWYVSATQELLLRYHGDVLKVEWYWSLSAYRIDHVRVEWYWTVCWEWFRYITFICWPCVSRISHIHMCFTRFIHSSRPLFASSVVDLLIIVIVWYCYGKFNTTTA